MNKEQKSYLINKLHTMVTARERELEAKSPTHYTKDEKLAKLKAIGVTGSVNYLEFTPTAAHKKNAAANDAAMVKIRAHRDATIDAIHLGDDKDAMSILDKFVKELGKIK